LISGFWRLVLKEFCDLFRYLKFASQILQLKKFYANIIFLLMHIV
jgi:hypothetical protein